MSCFVASVSALTPTSHQLSVAMRVSNMNPTASVALVVIVSALAADSIGASRLAARSVRPMKT